MANSVNEVTTKFTQLFVCYALPQTIFLARKLALTHLISGSEKSST